MKVREALEVIKQDVRIEKRDDRGRLMDYDISNYTEEDVKRISTYSDGGSYMILIII